MIKSTAVGLSLFPPCWRIAQKFSIGSEFNLLVRRNLKLILIRLYAVPILAE